MRGLIRWAKAVADGDPLEPAPATDDSSSDTRLLQQFQLLAEIADAHRTFARDSDAQLAVSGTARPSGPPTWPALGARLWGHLELRGLIGRGAFGEVYEAWDRHLERLVALKLLYRDRGEGDDAPEITEGRLLARVQHPHVVAVYGADRIDGRVGVWMELIDGRTLEEIVATTGPLSAQEATLIGLDACRALAAVHQAGLLHRDIKPRNVMRERGGRIVLMDFGAGRFGAKSGRGHQGNGTVAGNASGGGVSDGAANGAASIDAASAPVDAGVARPRPARVNAGSGDLVGTPRYLAPEIFDGEEASVRSDLYSLGVLLFYLVTGQTPVGGDTARAVRQEHRVERRVRLREARPDLPDEFIEAVQRALATAPKDRPASAAELSEDLLRASVAGASAAALLANPAKKRGRGRRALIVAAGLAMAVAAGLLGGRVLWPARARPAEARLLIEAPGISIDSVAASPDGRRLAMTGVDASGVSRLWLRAIDWFGARPIAGTEGAGGAFWSADGSALGFFANGKLWVVSASGGVPRALADAPNPRGGTWNRAGDIVFSPVSSGPLYRVSANGGPAVAITTADLGAGDLGHRWPTFLPDGTRVLFLKRGRSPSETGTYVTTRDGGPVRRVANYRSNVQVTPTGRMLFGEGPVLLSQRVNVGDLQLAGEPHSIARDVVHYPDRRQSLFAWSPGLLAYGAGEPLVTEFVAYTRAGTPSFARRVPGLVRSFSLSPDGTRLALERLDPDVGTDDIWLLDLQSEMLTRLTFDPSNDTDPIWSPDGRDILFSSDRVGGNYNLFRRPAHAGGTEVAFSLAAGGGKFAEDWSPDGRSVLVVGGDEGARRIYVILREAPESPRLLIDTKFLVDEPSFSPDGRYVAYHSTESGQAEVFVTPMANPSMRWQVSRGGVQPRWRADGRELFYLSLDGRLMAVAIDSLSPWRAGAPQTLVRAGALHSVSFDEYAARTDGQLFLIKREIGGTVSRLRVILNGDY